MLEVSGTSASDYAVVLMDSSTLTTSVSLTVLSSAAALPAPSMVSAVFGPDGSWIQLSFSAETNRGGMPLRFDCSRLFRFACAETSVCVWKDASTVLAYVSSRGSCAAPGHVLSLAASAAIKARCSLTVNCTSQTQLSWPNISTTAPSSFLTIGAPLARVSPVVVVNLPSSIGSCSSVLIDVTASTGDGGRAWNFSQVTVSIMDTQGASRDTSALRVFLQSSNFPRPVTIPSVYFEEGLIYTFQVTLCSFLGACSSSSKSLVVMSSRVPSLAIAGASIRSVKRSGILSVTALGSIPTCGGGNSSSSNGVSQQSLSYSWLVGRGSNNVPELALSSISKDPSRFVLPSFALEVSTWYTLTVSAAFRVSVSSSPSLSPQFSVSSASVSVQVFVAPGDLVVVIAGGYAKRSVRLGQVLQLDASRSYDEDSRESAPSYIRFAWSCQQTMPVLRADCSALFNDTVFENTASLSIVQLRAVDTAIAAGSSEGRVMLQIYEDGATTQAGVRSAQAFVTVVVLPSLAPIIHVSALTPSLAVLSNNISSIGSTSIFNSEQPLQLVGRVDVPASLNGMIGWHVDAASTGMENLPSFVLIAAGSLDIRNVTVFGSSVPRTYTLYLPLNTAILPTGIPLLFSLTCSLQEPGGASTSTIAVQINNPPRPGLFSVSPDEGAELTQLFTFSCTRWLDEDLPLSFQFGTVSSTGSQVTLRSRIPLAFADIPLSAGPSGSNNRVSCFAQVYDMYQGKSTASYSVRVYEGTVAIANITSYILGNIQDSIASNSVDSLKQSVTMSSSLLNRVNCSLAPANCSSLNRHACYRTPHTCGPCLSSIDYVGDDGDSNAMCYPAAFWNLSAASLQSSHKSCPGGCSGHGQCLYRSVVTENDVAECVLGDFSCTAYCLCDDGYVGSSSCAWTEEEALSKQQLRKELTASLETLAGLEDVDSDSMQSLISLFGLVSQSDAEISQATSSSLLDLTEYVLGNAVRAELTNEAAAELLPSIQSILSAAVQRVDAERRRRRRMRRSLGQVDQYVRSLTEDNSTSADYNTTVQRSQLVLDRYVSFLSTNLAPGQSPVESIQPSFRLHVRKVSIEDDTAQHSDVRYGGAKGGNSSSPKQCERSTSIALPSKAAEMVAGLQSGVLVVPLCPQNASTSYSATFASSMSISLLSVSGSLYGQAVDAGGSLLQANPTTVALSAFPCADPLTCFVDFVMSKQQYSNSSRVREAAMEDMQAKAEQEVYNVSCGQGSYVNHDHVCASDGKTYVISCRGFEEKQQGQCPIAQRETRCAVLLGSASADYGCELVDETPDNITCSCPLVNLRPHLHPSADARHELHSRHSLNAAAASDSNFTVPEGSISVSYVSLLQAVTTSFVTTVLTADDLSTASITRGYRVLVTLGTLVFVIVLALVYSHHADQLANKVSDAKNAGKRSLVSASAKNRLVSSIHGKSNETNQTRQGSTHEQREVSLKIDVKRPVEPVESKRDDAAGPDIALPGTGRQGSARSVFPDEVAVRMEKPSKTDQRAKAKFIGVSAVRRQKLLQSQKGRSHAQGLLDMAEQALPQVLGARSFGSLFKEELRRHHRWGSVIFHYSEQFPRVLRVISLATNIVIMLFMQSIFYNLTSGDDGSCSRQQNELDCLEDPSAFSTGDSKCYWVPRSAGVGGASPSDGECYFVQPSDSIKIVLFVAILSAIVSTPIVLMCDFIISKFIASPVATSAARMRREGEHDDDSWERSASDRTSGGRQRRLARITPSGQVSRSVRLSTNGDDSIASVRRQFDTLVAALKRYVVSLQSEKEKAEFRGKFVVAGSLSG